MAIRIPMAALALPHRETPGVDVVIGRVGIPVRGELKLDFDLFRPDGLAADGTHFAAAGPSPYVLWTAVRQLTGLRRLASARAQQALITHFRSFLASRPCGPCCIERQIHRGGLIRDASRSRICRRSLLASAFDGRGATLSEALRIDLRALRNA